jgi:hypothetical protein
MSDTEVIRRRILGIAAELKALREADVWPEKAAQVNRLIDESIGLLYAWPKVTRIPCDSQGAIPRHRGLEF